MKKGAVVSLSEFQSLSSDEQWKLVDASVKRIYPKNIKTCSPEWIDGRFVNRPMPVWKSDQLDIRVEQDNIYNGTLETPICTMKWQGYRTQLYDGELKMSPIGSNSFITGTCNEISFKFEECNLIFGVWPGFLLLYK